MQNFFVVRKFHMFAASFSDSLVTDLECTRQLGKKPTLGCSHWREFDHKESCHKVRASFW